METEDEEEDEEEGGKDCKQKPSDTTKYLVIRFNPSWCLSLQSTVYLSMQHMLLCIIQYFI